MENNENDKDGISILHFFSVSMVFKCLRYIFNTFTNSYMLTCIVFNTVSKYLHAYLSSQRGTPGRPWWAFITPAGKMHDKLCAFTDANTDAKQWFWMVSYGFQCFCMVSMMLSMIYTIVSTCFIGFQDFSLGPPS